MNKIKFNNIELEVESYSKNTYFSDGVISSSATCQVILPDFALIDTLMEEDITSIQIYYNDTLIYNLSNINARMNNINEYLNVERMVVNMNLVFSYTETNI